VENCDCVRVRLGRGRGAGATSKREKILGDNAEAIERRCAFPWRAIAPRGRPPPPPEEPLQRLDDWTTACT